MYKVMKETDWAYIACILDNSSWRMYLSKNGVFINAIDFSGYYSGELFTWFHELFGESCVYKYANKHVSYLSYEEGGPAKRIEPSGTQMFVKLQSAKKILFLIEKTEPYLRRKKPFVPVMKEYMKSKLHYRCKPTPEEKERRMQMIEEFQMIKKIVEQAREQGI